MNILSKFASVLDGDVDVEAILNRLVLEIDRLVKYGIDKLPDIERIVFDLMDRMFSPKQILRQIAMISVLQVALMCYNSLSDVWTKIAQNLTERGRKEKALLKRLKEAKTYVDWQEAAQDLDRFRGYDIWRKQDHSTLYDHKMLQKRIVFTREMLRRGDVFDLMFRMRGGLARDQFGMQHEGLFSRAKAGTKHIVETYLETVCDGLNFICDSPIADEEVSARKWGCTGPCCGVNAISLKTVVECSIFRCILFAIFPLHAARTRSPSVRIYLSFLHVPVCTDPHGGEAGVLQ
jgi:hypothetical protein